MEEVVSEHPDPFDPEWMAEIEDLGLLPLAELEDASLALPLAGALAEAGLPLLEIALRTPAAEDAIEAVAGWGELILGAGSVVSVEQARRVVEKGASFLVSPGFDPEICAWALDNDVPFFPGVATPSEALAARKAGLSVLKLFPAAALGGLPYLDAIAAPFPGLRFLPTGGIVLADLAAYLDHPAVFAVGGSFAIPRALVAARDWAGLGAHVQKVLAARTESP